MDYLEVGKNLYSSLFILQLIDREAELLAELNLYSSLFILQLTTISSSKIVILFIF